MPGLVDVPIPECKQTSPAGNRLEVKFQSKLNLPVKLDSFVEILSILGSANLEANRLQWAIITTPNFPALTTERISTVVPQQIKMVMITSVLIGGFIRAQFVSEPVIPGGYGGSLNEGEYVSYYSNGLLGFSQDFTNPLLVLPGQEVIIDFNLSLAPDSEGNFYTYSYLKYLEGEKEVETRVNFTLGTGEPKIEMKINSNNNIIVREVSTLPERAGEISPPRTVI